MAYFEEHYLIEPPRIVDSGRRSLGRNQGAAQAGRLGIYRLRQSDNEDGPFVIIQKRSAP